MYNNNICLYCGSKDVIPVHPFDYVKKCKNCGREFIEDHN